MVVVVNVSISSLIKSLIKFRTQPRHKIPNSATENVTVTLFSHVILNLRDVACVEMDVDVVSV